jgi:hypothetical protein
MRRLVFRRIATKIGDSVEVFWLTGFVRDDSNNWMVRVVFRDLRTSKLHHQEVPIGLLPILSLGLWFDHGVLQLDKLPGEVLEVVIPNVGKPEVITSADIPKELYPLPEGKAGRQRLFRYRTPNGTVLIPVVELVRALFIHSRALALALMRPAGLEQLYAPMTPGWRETVTIQFTREVAESTLNGALVEEFAWIVLDPAARRAWDSVTRLSAGQGSVLFEPPAILNSRWSFRGVRQGDQYFVFELLKVSGRFLPMKHLVYTHPNLKQATHVGSPRTRSGKPAEEDTDAEQHDDDIDVDDGDAGSTSYHNALAVGTIRRLSRFENSAKVTKDSGKVTKDSASVRKQGTRSSGERKPPGSSRPTHVTTGERAGTATLPPMEFKLLLTVPMDQKGDLEALDETIRHMRDKLPDVGFETALVRLRPGKAAAYVSDMPRLAMVVRITPPDNPPIVLIDIERTGIAALSLMALHFKDNVAEAQIEDAIRNTLDGWVEVGGHWSAVVEVSIGTICRSDRIYKAMIPREAYENRAEAWALRLMVRFGLSFRSQKS